MHILPSIYLLSGDSYAVVNYRALGNVYAIRTPEGIVMVDCGVPDDSWKLIQSNLEYWGINDPITHVLISHAHVDHCGNAKMLQERGAKIIMSEAGLGFSEAGGFNTFRDEVLEEGTYNYYPAFTPDVALKADEVTEMDINGLHFKFIPVPGHSTCSIAIYVEVDGRRVMFTGDAIAPLGMLCREVNIGWTGDPNFDRQVRAKSYERLQYYDVDVVLGGHGAPVLADGTKVLRDAAKAAFLAR